ncbi:O-antigen ligase family protein [Pseudoalteromonas sp. SWXJZ94C]|uniref:O-antigen ligase family protein n=1 Tax=unclassified Pseudoalteromonas TaxID=194690 RepID=UPI00140D9145|nr:MULTISPECIES: O-antigen ligase family protein [unclassified Pseudoalteromonas]MBH0057957.1 O-antigen ligase family protein [Pseudoalteromonas sp. SWXJZ94C]
MQKNNTFSSSAQFLVLSTIFMLCYWPTYIVPALDDHALQKVYFVIMVIYFLTITLATKTPLKVPSVAYIYLFPLVIMMITFLFSMQYFSFFHVSVLIKPLLLFSFVVFFYSFLTTHFTHANSGKIKKALTIIFVLQIIFILLQIILGDIAPLMLFNSKKVYEGFGFRAPGTFEWVYITCYFLSFFLAIYIIEFFFGKRKLFAFVSIILAFLAIFLSQSKTGYLATVLIAFYFTFLSMLLRLGIASKILISMCTLLVLFVAAIIYLEVNLDYVTRFAELILDGKLDGSTSTRTKQTLIALHEGLNHWYKGSPRALDGIIIENTYLDYLFRYGLFGLCAFILMISSFYTYSLMVCINANKLYRKGLLNFQMFQLSVGCHITFFAASLYSFTGTPIDAYRSALWSCFVIALTAYINSLIKQQSQPNKTP